jgi:hypothetical protein
MLSQLFDKVLVFMANFRWDVKQVVQDSLIAINFNDNREDILDDGGKLSELRVVELDLGI